MNADTSLEPDGKSDVIRGVLKRLLQVGVSILVQASILFTFSGRPDWVMAWAYVGLNVGGLAINALVIVPNNPELIAERAQIKEGAKGWDRVLAPLMEIGRAVVTLIVAGLDVRFGWSPQLASAIQLTALVFVALGYGLWSWAMASNRFFSGVVRIQKERDHKVVSAGPYRYVRHPGYLGATTFSLATPLLLGSLWALIPGALTTCVIIVRTALEDKTLREELPGYEDYGERVRYRLLPKVW